MKAFVYFTFLFLALASCKKNDDPTLNLRQAKWYLERVSSGGTVHLILEGTTTADGMTVKTYGDGVVFDKDVLLDSKGHFSDDVVISFSVTSVPSEEFVISTDLKIYKNAKHDMITVTLTSGKLKY
jgi:hypothetical protein